MGQNVFKMLCPCAHTKEPYLPWSCFQSSPSHVHKKKAQCVDSVLCALGIGPLKSPVTFKSFFSTSCHYDFPEGVFAARVINLCFYIEEGLLFVQ